MEAVSIGKAPSGEEFRVRSTAALPIETVRELSKLSPARAAFSLVVNWSASAAFIVLAVRVPHPAVIALSIFGVAAGQHGLAILAHQSAHYRMFETRWLNDLAGKICAYPLTVSVLTYRVIHRIHHNNLYSEIDPDLALMAGYPRGRAYLARKLLKDLFGITTVKNYLYFFGKPPSARAGSPLDDTSASLKAAAARERRWVIVFQLGVLAAAFALGIARWYLLLWFVPLVTVLQMLLRLRAVCEHGAVPDTKNPLQAARTNLVPALVRWIVFPHHMNFHVEHHLYPSVPHYRLGECHRAMVKAGALEQAEVVRGFGATLSKIFADAPKTPA